MTISDGRLLDALAEIERNRGVLWTPNSSIEARAIWDELERRGLIEFNPWLGRQQVSEAGRRAKAAGVSGRG